MFKNLGFRVSDGIGRHRTAFSYISCAVVVRPLTTLYEGCTFNRRSLGDRGPSGGASCAIVRRRSHRGAQHDILEVFGHVENLIAMPEIVE